MTAVNTTLWNALGAGLILLSIAATIISVVGMLMDFIEPSAMATAHTDHLLQVSLVLGILGALAVATFGVLWIVRASSHDNSTH